MCTGLSSPRDQDKLALQRGVLKLVTESDDNKKLAEEVGDFETFPAMLSAIRATTANGMPEKLDAFANAIMAAQDKNSIKYAVANVLRFCSFADNDNTSRAYSSYVDLYDFARLVSEKTLNNNVKTVALGLMNYIASDMVCFQHGNP